MPVEEDILEWHVNISPKSGPFVGHIVHLALHFSDAYPMEPPTVRPPPPIVIPPSHWGGGVNLTTKHRKYQAPKKNFLEYKMGHDTFVPWQWLQIRDGTGIRRSKGAGSDAAGFTVASVKGLAICSDGVLRGGYQDIESTTAIAKGRVPMRCGTLFVKERERPRADGCRPTAGSYWPTVVG